MSRIPPPLARRIDRLARRAHAFHRLAHHPLCQAYAPEVIAIGRRARLCRGCALAAGGAAVGLAAGLAAPAPPAPLLFAALAAFTVGVLASVWPPVPERRRSKLVSRLLPMALGGAVLSAGLAAASLAGLAAAAGVGAAVAGATLAYHRRGPDRAVCPACSERALASSCAGYRPMARRERAFQRLAGRWIEAAIASRPGSGPPGRWSAGLARPRSAAGGGALDSSSR
jgi:hypothetical protein